jgi:hypothetical protein
VSDGTASGTTNGGRRILNWKKSWRMQIQKKLILPTLHHPKSGMIRMTRMTRRPTKPKTKTKPNLR